MSLPPQNISAHVRDNFHVPLTFMCLMLLSCPCDIDQGYFWRSKVKFDFCVRICYSTANEVCIFCMHTDLHQSIDMNRLQEERLALLTKACLQVSITTRDPNRDVRDNFGWGHSPTIGPLKFQMTHHVISMNRTTEASMIHHLAIRYIDIAMSRK